MSEFLAAQVSDVPPGTMKTVGVGGYAIALANDGGRIYAFADTCTHAQCSLGTEGFLDGSIVTCGCHGAQFDVSTGNVLSLPATVPIRTYPVRVDGAAVLVTV
jgi:3-phenylpropionate/trans-cinnamate dioxygenase ferredoxin subunit